MRKQQNFHEDVDQSLRQSVPRSGNENDHTASGFGRNNHQPKIRQQSEASRRTGALEMKLGLYLVLKDFQMRVHVAGRHAAQFAIDAIEIGKHHQPYAKRRHGQRIEEIHNLQVTPSRRRKRFSMRSISPRSVS